MTYVITTVSRRASARAVVFDCGLRERLNNTASNNPPTSISTATKCSDNVTMCSSFISQTGAGKGMGSTAGKRFIRFRKFLSVCSPYSKNNDQAWRLHKGQFTGSRPGRRKGGKLPRCVSLKFRTIYLQFELEELIYS